MPNVYVLDADGLKALMEYADFEGGIVTTAEALAAAGVTEDEAADAADDYSFEGEADIMIDLALDPSDYFFTTVREQRENNETMRMGMSEGQVAAALLEQ